MQSILTLLLVIFAGATVEAQGATSCAKLPIQKPVIRGEEGHKLDAFMRKLVSEQHAGASVWVSRSGKTLLKGGYGLAERRCQTPNTSKTLFDIGSIPKTFTAAAIFQLAERKKLSLDDSISNYLSGVPEDKRMVTIRQLLSHTSGLESYISDDDFEVISREEAIRRALNLKLRWVPGQKEGYSNAGYTLLAAIIEQVSGISYDEYVAKNIFQSLGMNQTSGYRSTTGVPVATGYVTDVEKGTPSSWRYTWSLRGTGGMMSNVEDLHRWAQGLPKILRQESRTELFQPIIKKWTVGGWERFEENGRTLLVKGGANDFGFAGQVRLYPESKTVIIFLVNSRPDEVSFHQNVVGPGLAEIVFGKARLVKENEVN